MVLAALTLRPEDKTAAIFSGIALMKSEGGGVCTSEPQTQPGLQSETLAQGRGEETGGRKQSSICYSQTDKEGLKKKNMQEEKPDQDGSNAEKINPQICETL